MDMRDLMMRASKYGLLLSREGSDVRVRPVVRRMVPEAFHEELVNNKDELWAHLAWCEVANPLLVGSLRKLSALYSRGRWLLQGEWSGHERAIEEAFWSKDRLRLIMALEGREHWAEALVTETDSATAPGLEARSHPPGA